MLKLSFVIVMALFMVGCAEKQALTPVEKSTALSSTYLVKKIVVIIDQSNLEAKRIEMARKYALGERLKGDIKAALHDNGHFDVTQGDITLKISVTNFRLRSGATAFWFGAMAGADKIAINVTVERNNEVVKTFQTDISTAMGGLVFPAPSQRINRMSKGLSERIVSSL